MCLRNALFNIALLILLSILQVNTDMENRLKVFNSLAGIIQTDHTLNVMQFLLHKQYTISFSFCPVDWNFYL